MTRLVLLATVAGMCLSPGTLAAQSPATTMALTAAADTLRPAPAGPGACPGGNGIRISVTSGDTTARTNTVIDENRPVDTTIVFNVTEKRWTRTNLAAAISVGLSDESRGRYSICAGVNALLESATLVVRGARGSVHFKASLAELRNSLRLGPRTGSPQPRRL